MPSLRLIVSALPTNGDASVNERSWRRLSANSLPVSVKVSLPIVTVVGRTLPPDDPRLKPIVTDWMLTELEKLNVSVGSTANHPTHS